MSYRNTFTVMTANLRFGLADDGDNSWENRKSHFKKIFGRYPSTFIGAQESNNFQTEFLDRTLCDHRYIGLYNSSCQSWQNNPIFYDRRWQCLEHKHLFLSDTPEVESQLPGSRWPRQCVTGSFQLGNFTFVMANTHFDFEESVQKRSAEILTGFLSHYPPEYPVIITGDFNASPYGGSYNHFIDNGFSEVFRGCYSSTYHRFTGEDIGEHIDWILYRGSVNLVKREIIKESFEGKFPSDHYPVLAEFEF